MQKKIHVTIKINTLLLRLLLRYPCCYYYPCLLSRCLYFACAEGATNRAVQQILTWYLTDESKMNYSSCIFQL